MYYIYILDYIYIWLYYIISYYIISIISYHIIFIYISYHIISYHIILYHIISYHIISHHIILYHIISYYIISYHIILYYIMLYYIILYYIVLYMYKFQLDCIIPSGLWRSQAYGGSLMLQKEESGTFRPMPWSRQLELSLVICFKKNMGLLWTIEHLLESRLFLFRVNRKWWCWLNYCSSLAMENHHLE